MPFVFFVPLGCPCLDWLSESLLQYKLIGAVMLKGVNRERPPRRCVWIEHFFLSKVYYLHSQELLKVTKWVGNLNWIWSGADLGGGVGTVGLIPSRGSITKTEMREREVTDWLGWRQASQPVTPRTSRQVLLPVLATASVWTMSSLLSEREGNSHR